MHVAIILLTIVLLMLLMLLSCIVGLFNRPVIQERFSSHRLSDARSIVGSGDYKIVEFPNFFSKIECEKIISLAKLRGGMKSAETLDASNVSLSSYNPNSRTSKTRFIGDEEDALILEVSNVVAELTEQPLENQEMMQVAMYQRDGKFDEHYDACDSTPEVCAKFNRGSSNRLATLLVYLNDDFGGGQTTFTRLTPPITINPVAGKAIMFYDTALDTGEIIKESMHKAEKVTSGEKWICTKWVHTLPWS